MIIKYFKHNLWDSTERVFYKTHYTKNRLGLKFVKSQRITQEEYARDHPQKRNSS
jgi:hypothetical protein